MNFCAEILWLPAAVLTRSQYATLFSSSQIGSLLSMATISMFSMRARRLLSTHLESCALGLGLGLGLGRQPRVDCDDQRVLYTGMTVTLHPLGELRGIHRGSQGIHTISMSSLRARRLLSTRLESWAGH